MKSFHDNIIIIAHRGASAYAPENTLPAFEKAVELGADAIELDVQLTKDKHVVVFHDYHLERTSNGTGFLLRHNLKKLQRLDAGRWFSKEFKGEPIPTLEEVLARLSDRILFNIELKKMPFANEMVDRVLQLIEAYGIQDRCLLSSFDPIAIEYARVENPHIPTGLLFDKRRDDIWRGAWPFVLPSAKLATNDLIAEAQRHDKALGTWTVNEPKEMQRLLHQGIGRIITDVPDKLQKLTTFHRKKLDSK